MERPAFEDRHPYLHRAIDDTKRQLRLEVGVPQVIGVLVSALALAILWDHPWLPFDSHEQLAQAAALVAAVLIAFVPVFVINLAAAPYLVEKERAESLGRQVSALTSENLDVETKFAKWVNAISVVVFNNEDGDEFICEVIAWGRNHDAVAGGRTSFPWKVKWRSSDSRFNFLPTKTSGTLELAHMEVEDAAAMPKSHGVARLSFDTTQGPKPALGFMYPKTGGFPAEVFFVRILIAGKELNKATERLIEVQVNDGGGSSPRLDAKFIEPMPSDPHTGADDD